MLEYWMNKNSKKVIEKYPKLGSAIIKKLGSFNSAVFSVGVLEELLILTAVCLYATLSKNYGLWFGLLVAFSFHLVVHLFQTLLFGGYVLATLTSIICLPLSIYILVTFYKLTTISNLIPWCIAGILIMVVNLNIVHKLMVPLQKKMYGK